MMYLVYLLCLIPITKGIVQYFYYKRKRKQYTSVAGIVIGNHLEEVENLASYSYYYPIVEFTTAAGEVRQLISAAYNPDRPMYTAGTKVNLLLHPTDENRFLFDDKADRLLIPLFWITIGITGLVFATIFVLTPQ